MDEKERKAEHISKQGAGLEDYRSIPDVEGPHPSLPSPPQTQELDEGGTLFCGMLYPKQKIWPHMLGWEVADVFLEISGNHSQWVSRRPPRSLGGDGSLGAARSPSCCLGIGCSKCSFAW